MKEDYLYSIAQNTTVLILRSLLNGTEEIFADNTFSEDFGCDGLDIVEIMMTLEFAFNINIDDSLFICGEEGKETVNPALTVQDVINYCAAEIKNNAEDTSIPAVEPLPHKLESRE